MIAFRDVTFQHSAERVTLGSDVPRLILGLAVARGYHRGQAALPAVLSLKGRTPTLKELIYDRGYSGLRAESFYFQLQRAGLDGVFDLSGHQRGRSPFRGPEYLIDGQLFSEHLPPYLQIEVSPGGESIPFSRPGRDATADRAR